MYIIKIRYNLVNGHGRGTTRDRVYLITLAMIFFYSYRIVKLSLVLKSANMKIFLMICQIYQIIGKMFYWAKNGHIQVVQAMLYMDLFPNRSEN